MFTFAYFLTGFVTIKFMEGRLGTGICHQQNLKFFYYFLFNSNTKFGKLELVCYKLNIFKL